jgi:alpha-L-rhamnosidase
MTPSGSALHVSQLRCEALTDPLAIAHQNPRLSWVLESQERNQSQTAFEILAASDPDLLHKGIGDLWMSSKVPSNESINIEYAGKLLTSAQRCWWMVRVWDQQDQVSDWSSVAVFGVGLQQADWKAEWVGLNQTRELELPEAPFDQAKWIWSKSGSQAGLFIGVLQLPDDAIIVDSKLAISVAGCFRFSWAGEHFARSDYDSEPWRRPYIRNMNERLHPGANRFLIKAEQIDDEPAGILFKITGHLNDGSEFCLVSDESWRVTEDIPQDWHIATGEETWQTCQVVAEYGDAPWGILRGIENFLPPASFLRGEFTLPKQVRRATLFATALGWYDLRLNGERINQSYFDPGWTDYNIRLYYRAFDVTEKLQVGKNATGAVLADGWFSGYIGWYHQRDLYGKYPRFRGQLYIEYEDGTSEIIGSSSDWKATIGPIKEADILMGETYDARDEFNGWDQPGFDDSSWTSVDTGIDLSPQLQPHPAPPVVALLDETFSPKAITEPKPGVHIFDLGQNFAGIVQLKVHGEPAGQKIVMRFGEMLNADGTLYTFNLRTVRALDTYICRGDKEEIWSPRFTFHGFRYVEVTGLSCTPNNEIILGIPLSTDTPGVGSFECSDELVNQLASNVYWSQRSNFIDVITDCPQRDERLGWCDGTWTFIGAGALRTDVQGIYNKWTVDLDDAQYPDGLFPWLAPLVVTKTDVSGPFWSGSGPAWADAGIICPWFIYEIYGDVRQLEKHYPAMVRQVEWYVKTSRPDLLPPPEHKCLGDWLNQNAEIPADVFRTVFFAYSTGLVARAAQVLGKQEDAARFETLHGQIKQAFRRAYVSEDGHILGDTQSGYAFALLFELLDPDQVDRASELLIQNIREHNWLLTTGLEATLPLMLVLSKIGRNDIAYRILHNEEFPSWNYSIKNGATSIWERWDSWTPDKGFGYAGMNSFNHFSLGAVYQWMVENIGGIRRANSAYKELYIAPEPGGRLTWAKASYNSVHGLVQTEWGLNEDVLDIQIHVPANTSATIVLPATSLDDVTESGSPLSAISDIHVEKQESNGVYLHAGSGSYEFQIHNPVIAPDPKGTGWAG